MSFNPLNTNYKSVAGHEEALREQFIEEAKLGMMVEMSLEEAQKLYPGRLLRLSALGAIEKPDATFRVLTDATHGVQINNEVRPRDQMKMPGAADARATMCASAHLAGVHFSIQADISKAHRRFKHRQQDWGLLGCQLTPGRVWLNKVGTFRVGSASYWFSRLAAGIARISIALAGRSWTWQLVYADDIRWTSYGPDKYICILSMLLLWAMAGAPFSWHKTRGGLAMDWIGFYLDYSRFEIGISEARCLWIIKWIEGVTAAKAVMVKNITEGLGRLVYVTGVLPWMKPFLAPIFSWSSAAPEDAFLPLPPAVKLTMSWIGLQLKKGKRTCSCKNEVKRLGEIFRADSKGEVDFVVLGGWECRNGTPPKEARWFSMELRKEDTPRLFCKGHASRTVASSELLATLVCVALFCDKDVSGEGKVLVRGATDNKGNKHVVYRFHTTKFPLSMVLMELATRLGDAGLELDLEWVPRASNVEADDLTNNIFEKFDMAKRINLKWKDLNLPVIEQFMIPAEQLF
jgi:hypothetical protein